MTVYKVVDMYTRSIVKETYSRLLAYRYAHKMDAKYGAVRYAVLFEQDSLDENSGGETSKKGLTS